MAIKNHPGPHGDTAAVRYDISLKVGNTIYTVLYTPPPGTYGAQFSAGEELLVSVGSKTITYNDTLGNSREVPILSRKPASDKNAQ